VELIKKIQLIKIAKAHYIDGKAKNQIAEEFNVSRFKAARLLDEAVKEGIVQFVIPELVGFRSDLGEALEKKYNIKHCAVVSTPELPSDALTDSLADSGADIITELALNGMNVGIASGRVISAIADKMKVFPKLNVIQAAGVQDGMNFRHSSLEIVHRLASLGGGHAYPLFAPMWLDKKETAESMMLERSIKELHSLYNNLDILVTGIGSWYGKGSSGMFQSIPEEFLNEVIAMNATADLCSVILDDQGREIKTKANSLNLALKADQIRQTPEIIAIAGGTDKYKAIHACLRGDWVTTLVTDEGTAKYLLDQ